ncbi:hypothetical protein FQA39_LY06960 [Lamprigera yunnana]|nr:hypothetical protein FQA39_LY06960 [Lamprigera yunnana]
MNIDSFNVGDKVFAKVKGYPAWPAVIIGDHADKYNVKFYATEEIAFVESKDLYHYLEHKDSFVKRLKQKDYNDAVDAIEQAVKDSSADGNLQQTTVNSKLNSTRKPQNKRSIGNKWKLSHLIENSNINSIAKKFTLEPRCNTEESAQTLSVQNVLGGVSDNQLKEKSNSIQPPGEVKDSGNDELEMRSKCLGVADMKIIPEDYLLALILYSKVAKKEEITYRKKPVESRKDIENGFVLAKLPSGKFAGIKYPKLSHFDNEFLQAIHDGNNAASVLSLKEFLEGHKDSSYNDCYEIIMNINVDEMEIQHILESEIIENKRNIVNHLITELRLIELDSQIRNSLGLKCAYPHKVVQYLQEMLESDVKPLMLKKHPIVIEGVRRLKRYIGNVTAWNFSKEQCIQFEKEANQVRNMATAVYTKFLKIYGIPDEEFWKTFDDDIESFNKKVKHLSQRSILAFNIRTRFQGMVFGKNVISYICIGKNAACNVK